MYHAGRIQQIFDYTFYDREGEVETFLFVTPLAELSEADAQHDPYRQYKFAGGELYYAKDLPGIIVSAADVLCHFARTPVNIPEIIQPCIHVLPLDKVRPLSPQSGHR